MLSFMELTNLNLCWKELAQENVFTCKKGYRFPSRHDLLYFILRGRVRLAALTPEGEEKNLWYLREGCFFNETPAFLQAAPVLQGMPSPCLSQWPLAYPTTVSAFHECTETSLLGSLPFERVRKEGLRRPEMLLNLCQSFSLKVGLLAQNMASFTLETPRRRVSNILPHVSIRAATLPGFSAPCRIWNWRICSACTVFPYIKYSMKPGRAAYWRSTRKTTPSSCCSRMSFSAMRVSDAGIRKNFSRDALFCERCCKGNRNPPEKFLVCKNRDKAERAAGQEEAAKTYDPPEKQAMSLAIVSLFHKHGVSVTMPRRMYGS